MEPLIHKEKRRLIGNAKDQWCINLPKSLNDQLSKVGTDAVIYVEDKGDSVLISYEFKKV